ncbi:MULTISPECIES: methyltransferase domain-containing protein [Bacillus]|uniref:methyltransferase domain-containing protein n=1 Tax=Bacillus TaxID=1386 RepID=UPI0003109999|nr:MULTISPECIES: methyltransferase domain-containing protein [Bacillus]
MKEIQYDEVLHIKTAGEQKGFNQSIHYHRYEPTPYFALEQLFQHLTIQSTDRIVDFGCGKGRLNFFIHELFNASVVGIEMNEFFYLEALENKKSYISKKKKSAEKIHFLCCLAEEYTINPFDNIFYFFNPFSIQIFMKIIRNILLSVEQNPRVIKIVLYYASDEYMFYLENQTIFELVEEVRLTGLYEKNPNERFLVYQLSY